MQIHYHNEEAIYIQAFMKSISLFKWNTLAVPFELAFKQQKELKASGGALWQLMQIHYCNEEAIYIQALPDYVIMIFSTIFKEDKHQYLV
jgi:actin related protein 2/3 complex subunit 2